MRNNYYISEDESEADFEDESNASSEESEPVRKTSKLRDCKTSVS